MIAFEAMNHWQADGGFRLHVFTRTTSPATQRDGWVRPAITTLLDRAQHQNCTAVVVENPDFAGARAVGRETLGRGARGKRLRRAVAGTAFGGTAPHLQSWLGSINAAMLFNVYAVVMLAVTVLTVLTIPETRGKDLAAEEM